MSLSMACHAGDAIPSSVPSAGPQIMIYFRQPLWTPGAQRIYGLRIDQTSAPSSSPNAPASGAMRRREIVSLEIGQHADLRVELARRLIWDVGRQEFGLGSIHPSLVFHLQPRAGAPADPARVHP
jgi:hypothetical protein